MRKHLFGALWVAASSLYAVDLVAATPVTWSMKAAPTRAQISGGPWVLGQGTAADPLGGYPTPNPATSRMQPYYQSFVTGDATNLQGFFDYRVRDHEEAVVAAISHDGGATWTFQKKVLTFLSPSLADASAPASDAGEGHPFVATIGTSTLLYTLDRSIGNVDASGLFVRVLAPPTATDPLGGAPATAAIGDPTAAPPTRTSGLLTPDGILGVVPATSAPTRILYLAKDVSVTPNATHLRLAHTTDGVAFVDDGVATGLTDASTTFIGPRGTLLRYADGRYGLFFSAGLAGEDADAIHFVGYAESIDLVTWTVVNGAANPLLSIDATKDPTGGQPWYAGRVYAPNVALGADGCSATMIFSGYKTLKPKTALDDYRQIGRVAIARTCDDAGDDGGAGSGGNRGGEGGSSRGSDPGPGSADVADGGATDAGGGPSSGCSIAAPRGSRDGGAFAACACGLAVVAVARVRPRPSRARSQRGRGGRGNVSSRRR